jgi:hypothetical protein
MRLMPKRRDRYLIHVEKIFLVLRRTDPIPQRQPGNDFSSDREAKEHRNALRNNHAQGSTLPHRGDEKEGNLCDKAHLQDRLMATRSIDGHEHRTVFAVASCVAPVHIKQHRNKPCRTKKDQALMKTIFVLMEDLQ